MGLPLRSPVAKLSCEAATEEKRQEAELHAPDPSYRSGELLARNNIRFARNPSGIPWSNCPEPGFRPPHRCLSYVPGNLIE